MINTTVLNVIAWILLGITVVFTAWYIFGNSPIETTIMLSLASLLLMKVWSISNGLSYFRGDYQNFKENIKESFQRAKEHDEKIEKELTDIKRLLTKR